MKSVFTQLTKAAAMAVALLSVSTSVQAQAIKPGETVKAFIENEDMGLIGDNVPLFSTDEELNNWAWAQYSNGNTVGGRDDQRGWRGVFEVEAPAAGKYAMEIKLRSTTNNWMVALTASQGLDASERANLDVAPDWFAHYRPLTMTTVEKSTIEISPAQGDPDDPENYIPAITEDVFKFASGEWETIYVPVDLENGHNYVTFWLSRRYWDLNTLTGPDGSVNGFYVQSIKLLPEGSGNVASVLQQASYKIWYQTWYPHTNGADNANLKADYQTLLNAVAGGNYSASTAAVQAGIDATAAIEDDLRTGAGFPINSAKLAFDLPFYFYSSSTGLRENEHGAYSDAPVVFEYTNNKTIIWKFKAEVSGTFYPELYIGSQNETSVKVTVLADDQETVVMPTWNCPANTGAWQVYDKRSSSSVARFDAEAGKTYYIKLEFDSYANLRGLFLHQLVKDAKTYAELEEMSAKGEDFFAKYQEGSDGFFSIGGNKDVVNALEDALALASELDENSTPAEITEAYYAIEEAIAKIESIKPINVIPTSAGSTFDFTNAEFYNRWTVEGGGSNIGYVVANGGANYSIYNKQDGLYNIAFNCSAPSGGGILRYSIVSVLEDGTELVVATKDFDIQESGGWANWDMETANYLYENVPVPAGSVQLQVFGVQAGGNGYIGNYNMISFTYVEGSEGKGKEAYDKALADYAVKFSSDALKQLIQQAEATVQQYSDPKYEQQLVDALKNQIEKAQAVADSEVLSERVAAYKALETAIANMANIREIAWIAIPTTEENPFTLSAGTFTRWQMENGGNIGYAYAGGSVLYYVNVTEAMAYDMQLSVSIPSAGGQMRITITSAADDTELYNNVIDVPNTEGWGNKQDIYARNINLPLGYVKVLVYGETAAENGFVGNTHAISFVKNDPSGVNAIQTIGNADGQVYNLQGQKVNGQLRRGIYIVNGKKVIK